MESVLDDVVVVPSGDAVSTVCEIGLDDPPVDASSDNAPRPCSTYTPTPEDEAGAEEVGRTPEVELEAEAADERLAVAWAFGMVIVETAPIDVPLVE